MNYNESLNFIHSRNKFGIRLGLDAITSLLKRLGNPHKSLKFIHIAGTNGKGSTTSYIADILAENGYKVGKFISPYVHKFNERIQINNTDIADEDFANYASVVRDTIEKYDLNPTEFETITAIGMLYFLKSNCDYVVLEVGMGGRFDATNVIDAPTMSVITSISIDHTEYLGDTIEKIAYEKCGIIKNGSKLVSYADNPKEADDVIIAAATDKNVPLLIPNKRDIKIIKSDINGTDFVYANNEYHINMLGIHQVYNAVSAIEATKIIGIGNEAIKSGLAKTKFAGRLDIICNSPLIIEDGAHNISGIIMLKKALESYFGNKKIIIVMAMLKDKEYEGCVKELSSVTDVFIATEADNPRKATADELYLAAKKYIQNVYCEPDVNIAIKKARDLCTGDSVICVCGSLYLLGSIK